MSKAVITVVFVVLVGLAGLAGLFHPSHVSDANVRAADKPEKSVQNQQADATPRLEETTQKFLDTIRAGPPTDLLNYWSDDGVTFGVDSDPISKAHFRQQIDRKSGVFCFFFDSNCLRSQVAEARRHTKNNADTSHLYCYRDLITSARNVSWKVSQRKEAGNLLGDLRIRIENSDAIKGNEQTELEFSFAVEKGNWKLTSVIYN